MRHRWTCLAPWLLASACAPGGAARARTADGRADGAGAVQRAWWEAYARADTAYLQAHSASALSLTTSSGRTTDRAATLAESAGFAKGGRLAFAWGDETVRAIGPDAAVATSRVTESEGATTQVYRYATVLERRGGAWRVVVAQSTRETVFTSRVPVAVAGPLADFAGSYRTPRGLALRVVARDSGLTLVEPSGAALPMDPVGPGLFEFGTLSPSNGLVRFAFTRDAAGRVSALTRLVPGSVTTFPRLP